MTVFLDIIGSWVIRAALIAIMLTLTINLSNVLYQSSMQANTNGYLAAVDSAIYVDVSAAGYSGPSVSSFNRSNTFKSVSSQSLYFYADVVSAGGVDSIYYYTSYSSATKLYTLYRQLNNSTALPLGNNFSNITFKYYNAKGDSLSSPYTPYSNIKSVRVMLTAQYVLKNAFVNTKGLADSTCYVSIDRRISPPNLL